jgi:ribulose-phosphate 3-epimerase
VKGADMAGFTVTLACADPLCLGDDIEAARRGGAAGVHIDVMDGRYVPNLCMSFAQAGAIKESYPSLEMDIHMMVADPFCWVEELVRLQPQRVAVHLDSTPFTYRFLERMKAAGISPGVAWNPSQPLELLFPLARRIEYVLLMAVEPGFSGQSMLQETYQRIAALDAWRRREGLGFRIMVDGGVDLENGSLCVKAGADILVGGAFVCFGQEGGVEAACRRLAKTLFCAESSLGRDGMD